MNGKGTWINAVLAAVIGGLLLANLKETYNLGKTVAALSVEVKTLHERLDK